MLFFPSGKGPDFPYVFQRRRPLFFSFLPESYSNARSKRERRGFPFLSFLPPSTAEENCPLPLGKSTNVPFFPFSLGGTNTTQRPPFFPPSFFSCMTGATVQLAFLERLPSSFSTAVLVR